MQSWFFRSHVAVAVLAVAAFAVSRERRSLVVAGLLAASGIVGVVYGLIRTEFLTAISFPGPIFGIIEVPMDEWVEIGVSAPGEGNELGEPLYLERHRIRRGEQMIRITVPREPARAGIEPYRKLLDRQRDDSVVRVEATKANSAGKLGAGDW